MLITYATQATPGLRNEDYVVAGPSWVVVLDGATARPEIDSGCRHQVTWLVRRLAGELAGRLTQESGTALADLLADAITATCAAHGGGCDLDNPDSPSATVAVLRRNGDLLDWLVLSDSSVVVDTGADVIVATDDRTARLPSYTVEAVRAARNDPSGFWVASTRPEAAYEAVTGAAPVREVRRAGVFSDGGARLVERFHLVGWAELLDLMEEKGPCEVLRRTRAAEAAETAQEQARRRGKRYDDATAVLVRLP